MVIPRPHLTRFSLPGRFLAPVLICGLLLTGCSLFGEEESSGSDGVSFGSDGVRSTVQDKAIVIKNRRSEPIWVRVVGTSQIPVIIFSDPPNLEGDPIPSGEQRVVEFEEILMDEDEDEISVSWWNATMEDGERVVGEVSSFRVEL